MSFSEVIRSLLGLVVAAMLATSGGCVFQWNDEAPAIPLEGSPPSLDSLPHLNTLPAGLPSLLRAADESSWVGFCEYAERSAIGRGNTCKRLHLARFGAKPTADGAVTDEVLLADGFYTHPRAVFIVKEPPGATARTLIMHRPGDRAADDVPFTVPLGRSLFYISRDGTAFVYWILDKATTTFTVHRRDGRKRVFPIPPDVDPTRPAQSPGFEFLLSEDGSVLVMRDPSGILTAHSTFDDSSVPLGPRPADYLLWDAGRAVITIGDDGLRSVPLDGSADRLLAPGPLDPATLQIPSNPPAAFADTAWYATAAGLWRVPLDGSAAPTLVQPGAARLMALGPRGEIVHSLDARDRFVGGAGDGWLGTRRIMERGRLLTFSDDGRRLHFLERAAALGTVGDLTSVPTAGGDPRVLGLNVHAFAELSDGRVLSIENRVYAGTWNRLVVIDEDAATRRWVVPAATEFLMSRDRTEIVAAVVTGAAGYDIVRVPVPARVTAR